MAYLNVRERRIEAKIVYVGPDLAGKSTNFARLRATTQDARIARVDASLDDESLLSIAWQPPEPARFRDCDVLVKVIAHQGALSEPLLDRAFSEADGVVVVADAHPMAQARNRDSLVAVRQALQRSERQSLPLVVQVNKADLPDALTAGDVVSAMDAGSLRHVVASALRGDGVVDTLEAALNEVIATMQREGDAVERGQAAQPGSPDRANGTSDAGHPLLAALRQVLRDTVREHVQDLESRLLVRLNASLDLVVQGQGRLEASEATAHKLMTETTEHVAVLRSRFDELARDLQSQRKSWFT